MGFAATTQGLFLMLVLSSAWKFISEQNRKLGWKSRSGILMTLTLLTILSKRRKSNSKSSPQFVLFSTFLSHLSTNEVARVYITLKSLIVTLKNNSSYTTLRIPSGSGTADLAPVIASLQTAGVPFGTLPPSRISSTVGPMIVALIPFIYLLMTYRMLSSMMKTNTDDDESNCIGSSDMTSENVVSFKDVAGIDAARAELEEVVDGICNPLRYNVVGARIPRGVLLSGPPGCGKTLLARALASEISRKSYETEFIYCSASDFVETFVGRGAARVRQLFARARKARHAIIFIDEIDALGKARGGLHSHDEREQTLNQLLTEMDGFSNSDSGVLVLAATNRPEVLDAAIKRPGRFDKHVRVTLPNCNGRAAILKVYASKINTASDVDLNAVATLTNGFSGAALSNLLNDAALNAVRLNRSVVKMSDITKLISIYKKDMAGL